MDYASGPYNIMFPAGQTTATFNVPITDDMILEGNENFMLTIDETTLPDGVTRGTPGEVTVTIVDDDRKHKNYNAIHRHFYWTYFNCKSKSICFNHDSSLCNHINKRFE